VEVIYIAKRLFVGGLPFVMTNQDLEQLFSQVGKVESATIIVDKFSGRSKGFGFVEMSSEEEAQEAIKKFQGFEVEGRTLAVNEARPLEPRENRRSDNGRGNNY
jgi:cold-inducible RNA-binding protein